MLFDNDMFMFLTQNNIDTNNNLVNKNIGLLRGNMFEDEYKPYKNYNPVSLSDNKDNLLLNLYETNFAIIDLNLYLDLYPNNNEMYEIYKKYVKEFDNLKKLYEEKYGPLENSCVDFDSYKWIDNPWPWDNYGGANNV